MHLELANGKQYENPDSVTIAAALATLDGKSDNYAILSRADETYMQTCGSPEQGFILEHREGSEDAHLQSQWDDLKLEDVIRAFTLYASGDPAWQTCFEWKPLDVGVPMRSRAWIILAIAFLIVVGLLLLVRATK